MPVKTKKAAMNEPKKGRVFETRDVMEVEAFAQVLYKEKIPFKISVKTYGVGEPVKFRFKVDPITD